MDLDMPLLARNALLLYEKLAKELETQGGCVRRGRPLEVIPVVVPRVRCIYSPGRRYDRTLENIISKLINALNTTNVENGDSDAGSGTGGGIGGGNGGGAGGTGSSGTGGSGGSSGTKLASLLGFDIEALGRTLLEAYLLPE